MMHRLFTSLAAPLIIGTLLAGPMTSVAVVAQVRSLQPNGEQDSAREQMQAGLNMSIRDIERAIIPQMESTDEYIGFEYDPAAQAYRLKFIRNGRVIWVDVDARTARVLRVSR